MLQLYRVLLMALVLAMTGLFVSEAMAEDKETVHIGRISETGTPQASSADGTKAADAETSAEASTDKLAEKSTVVSDAPDAPEEAPKESSQEAAAKPAASSAAVEKAAATPAESKPETVIEALDPALAKSRAEYEKAMAEREFTILPGVSPIHDLILTDGLVCETFDGGYMIINKKDDGKKVVHYECGRLWCDEQSRSYRIYYHGEYASDFSKSFIDKTKVEPWDKKPALCNAN